MCQMGTSTEHVPIADRAHLSEVSQQWCMHGYVRSPIRGMLPQKVLL